MGDQQQDYHRNEMYQKYKDHFDVHRINTDLALLEDLRDIYGADYHITYTYPHSCDLLGYAAAGHAGLQLETGEFYHGSKVYQEPGSRISGKPGALVDKVHFGRYRYSWEHEDFFMYNVEYTETSGYRPPTKLFYILSPNVGEKSRGKQAIDKLLHAVGKWTTDLHEEIYVFDDGIWKKDSELWNSVQGASWDEVILNPTTKANLIGDVQSFFDNKDLYKSLSVPWKRGLLFHGIPGNGKTISIKALINALGARKDPVPSLYVKSFDGCQGKKYSIHQVFSHARIMAPCLLIFEDIDSLITEKTRSYFLNEVDGLESNDGILMIGSTNHLNKLDPAISKRPSRFDRKYHFKLPDLGEREAYCKFWRRKLANSELVEFDEELCSIIAKLSDGFSFAYLKELFIVALLTVARGGQIEEKDLVQEEENEDSKSSSDAEAVVVEHEDKEELHQITDAKKKDTLREAKETPKKKRTTPEVEVPEHLKDNLLLKVIKGQVEVLLEEMDNTKEEEWASSRPQVGASESDIGMIQRVRRMMVAS